MLYEYELYTVSTHSGTHNAMDNYTSKDPSHTDTTIMHIVLLFRCIVYICTCT